jgi:hypothetical protein
MIYFYYKGFNMTSYIDIVKAHRIEDVKVFGNLVLVNDGYKDMSYHYSSNVIAKAVANKLLMFKGAR